MIRRMRLRTALSVLPAALVATALCVSSAWAQTPQRQTQEDDYTRYELLGPDTAQFRILYEVTATTAGAPFFFNAIRKGSVPSDESVVDMMSGQQLKWEVVSGAQARKEGHPTADLETEWLKVHLARPVPKGGEGRVLIDKTHSFNLFHDYTESRPGVGHYCNVVRAGSSVSNPSAVLLDTGEVLKVETLSGAGLKQRGLDAGEPVTDSTQVVVISFPVVKAGQSVRLRITETYTDSARYLLDGDELVWDRAFGRPRLYFENGRNDDIQALIRARRVKGVALTPASAGAGPSARAGGSLPDRRRQRSVTR